MDSLEVGEHDGDVVVRTLSDRDLGRLVKMDQAWVGRNRSRYLEDKLKRALGAGVQVSLGAEIDGTLVGALLGAVQYGEFGRAEPVAVLDTILVDPDFTGRGLVGALMQQLEKNLAALRIERLRTEVAWTETRLMSYLAHEGFVPVPRLVLEKTIG